MNISAHSLPVFPAILIELGGRSPLCANTILETIQIRTGQRSEYGIPNRLSPCVTQGPGWRNAQGAAGMSCFDRGCAEVGHLICACPSSAGEIWIN